MAVVDQLDEAFPWTARVVPKGEPVVHNRKCSWEIALDFGERCLLCRADRCR